MPPSKTPSKKVRRRPEFHLVAYYFARLSIGTTPPPVLGVTSLEMAYNRFYAKLGGGRPKSQFINSMRNARAAFEAHMPTSSLPGWVDSSGKPFRKDAGVKKILDDWALRSDADLEKAALAYL